MDTFKEQQELTDMFNQGNAPWEVWKEEALRRSPRAPEKAQRHAATGDR
jgi:hypothetical protein